MFVLGSVFCCLILVTSAARIKKIPLDELFEKQQVIKIKSSPQGELRNPIEEFLEEKLKPLKDGTEADEALNEVGRSNRIDEATDNAQHDVANEEEEVVMRQKTSFLQTAFNIAQGTFNAIIGR
jgi:hypothetical protein